MMPARRTSPKSVLVALCIGLFLGHARPARADKIDDLIHALLVDQSHKVRTQAAIVLGQIGGDRAVRPLIEALRDSSDTVRGSAAVSLGKLGDRRAVEPLTKLKNDASSFVQQSVTRALGDLQHHDQGFGPPTPGARFYVAIRGTSTKLGGEVGKTLREALLDEVKRLPRISITIDGPPTAQLLASRKMVGYTLDGNVTSMKHSGDQLDCDVQISIATLPGNVIKATANAGASVTGATSLSDPGAQKDCLAGAAQQLAEEVSKFFKKLP